ncbi:MAG: lipid-A-disaccharide synthase [Muribaculaceae bacterium]|nr:lipid-A-disaccharide synthase [Muribaculaceae bacterium]
MQNKKIKVFIIAGEVSGDVLGGRIIEQMRDGAEFIGVGGENMMAAGMTSLFPMSDLAVMGVLEVVANARTLTRRMRQTADEIIRTRPDIVLTIDAPGFARGVIKLVKKSRSGRDLIKQGLRFHHFVAPQVWAWRPGRAKKYAKTFDKLYAFFDFEVPYFTKYGLSTIAVGHPIADKLIGRYPDAVPSEKIITLIPGSRMSEVKKLLPVFRQIVDMMVSCGYTGYKFVMPTVETTNAYLREQIDTWPIKPELVPAAQRYDWYSKTYIAIAASGTVSAELAMIHIPAIIIYKMNPVTTWLVRQVIRTKWVSLVNVLLQRTVYPEFLGPASTAQNVVNVFCELSIPSVREKMVAQLRDADKLWRPGDRGAVGIIADDIYKTICK